MRVSSCCRRLALLGLVLLFGPAMLFPILGQEPGVRGVGVRQQTLIAPVSPRPSVGNAGLFVGVNQFSKQSGLGTLQFAVHDAIELAFAFVVELQLIPPENCWLLIEGQPSADSVQQHLQQLTSLGVQVRNSARKSEILEAFSTVVQCARQETDLLVCCFSSHGFQQSAGSYIMPADGNRRFLVDTGLSLATIEDQMDDPDSGSRAGHRLLLIDACQERQGAKGQGAGTPMDPAFEKALKKSTGQSKLASCSPGEFSYEDASLGGVGHGVFTYGILDGLRGAAVPDTNRLITLDAVATHASKVAQDWTMKARRDPQTPILSATVNARQLPLARQADDLQTMLVTLQKHPLDQHFTAAFRERLERALPRLSKENSEDNEFLQQTQQFLRGDLKSLVFCRYATSELDRILGVMAAVAPVKPAPADAPMKPAPAASPAKPNSNPLTNSIGMVLLPIPAGTFTMGSPASEKNREDDETQHQVTLSKPFYMGRTEVTQGQWKKVMGTEPWKGIDFVQEGDDYPAVYISWDDAVAFCKKLSEKEGKTYRLPTEAEWEYACRGGTKTAFSFGDDEAKLSDHAWWGGVIGEGNAQDEQYAHRVAQKLPNPFGLHDMHGNVWEWCRDWHDDYPSTPLRDPQGPDSGSSRVLRGSSWFDEPSRVRCAARYSITPGYRDGYGGFRLVLE
jgi:formylglycine-generating enzyme required for sulfatase activity